jgi:hypothetical protein
MHNRIRPQLFKQSGQPVVLGGKVEVHEADLAVRYFVPGPDALANRPYRGE